MSHFKEMTEQRAVPITDGELREWTNSNVWLAFCQRIRQKQRHIHASIRQMQPDMRLLAYAHLDQLDEMINTVSEMRENNIYDEKPEIKANILSNLKEQLKGDIEQWKPKQ